MIAQIYQTNGLIVYKLGYFFKQYPVYFIKHSSLTDCQMLGNRYPIWLTIFLLYAKCHKLFSTICDKLF